MKRRMFLKFLGLSRAAALPLNSLAIPKECDYPPIYDFPEQNLFMPSIAFNKTGTLLRVSKEGDTRTYDYLLRTPWDMSTAEYKSIKFF